MRTLGGCIFAGAVVGSAFMFGDWLFNTHPIALDYFGAAAVGAYSGMKRAKGRPADPDGTIGAE